MAENSEKQCDLDNFVVVDKVEETGSQAKSDIEDKEVIQPTQLLAENANNSGNEINQDKANIPNSDSSEIIAKEKLNINETSVKSGEDLKNNEPSTSVDVSNEPKNNEGNKTEEAGSGENNLEVDKAMTQEEWAKRESALLEKIKNLQTQQDDNTIQGMQIQLKVKCEENEILKAKMVNLQTELNAVLKKPNAKNKDIVAKIKKQNEELLTKAKGMIFDKTKMIKNQELQIEALTAQVTSLKEVASITKNLLEIRNLEVGHLNERIEVMNLKIQAERDRYNLMSKKVDAGTQLNAQLKAEYELQLRLFKELKERYEQKFLKLEENIVAAANKNNNNTNDTEKNVEKEQ